jgi:predicted transcriptional regulator
MSHKALADVCGIGNATVLRAVDRLLDDGLISCLGLTGSEGKGSKKRVYRVIHPTYVEAQRAAIEVMGEEWLPSKRARALRAG